MTKYLVVGSPGRYTVIPVEKGDKDYASGMSEQAALETADVLNAQFVSGTTTAIPKDERDYEEQLSSTSFGYKEPVDAAEIPEETASLIEQTRTARAAAGVLLPQLHQQLIDETK